jgi:hypothetical protein
VLCQAHVSTYRNTAGLRPNPALPLAGADAGRRDEPGAGAEAGAALPPAFERYRRMHVGVGRLGLVEEQACHATICYAVLR